MKKNLFKLLIFGIFIFLAFDINVKAAPEDYQLYLEESNLANLEVYQSTGVLKVTGVSNYETFEAHKILDVYYNSETNEMLYGFTSTFYDFLFNQGLGIDSEHPFTVDDYFALTSGDITSGSTITASELDLLMSNYAAYIKQNSITGLNMAVSYQVASLISAAGAYLVLPTKTDDRVYAVMVGNIDMYASGTEWKVNDETIVAKTSNIDIRKILTDMSGNYMGNAIIGRDFISKTEITAPIYPTNATNKKLALTEMLEDGYTFGGLSTIGLDAGGISYSNNNGIFTDADGNIVATATFTEQVLTVEFNADYIYTPDINISYSVRLNENAKIGSKNIINVELTYSNDAYGTGATVKTASALIYTYGIQIYKYDYDDNSPLSGAVFEVYNDKNLTDLIGTITTDETGIGRFVGVEAGSIYLKEVKAPTGYKLMRDIITISELAPTAIEDEVEIEVPYGYRMAYIPNEKMGILPVTGGIGTVIYTIIGLITIAGSISFISIYKSKKNNENFQV